jgi:DNA-binding transcriptional LysR family regulator
MPRTSQLSIELLQTFLSLLDHGGDAAAAAAQLAINQPSMSKRLAFLQHAGRGITRAWLKREGKTWKATAEGQRVLPAVRDIVLRYERLGAFVQEAGAGMPAFTFACGQQAATGFVLRAARRFHGEQPDVSFRISQLRGQARIEGVASGALDLATVTDREETILATARADLHIDALPEEPLLLVAMQVAAGAGGPPWHRAFAKLPARGVPVEALKSFPLILPEPDADVRRTIDAAAQAAGILTELQVALEIGGWQTILAYAREGLGVGVVTETALAQEPAGLEARALNRKTFPPPRIKLICRTRPAAPGELDLSGSALRFRELLLEEGRKAGGGEGGD